MLTFFPPSEVHRSDLLAYAAEVREHDNDFDGSAGLGEFSSFDLWLERIRLLSSDGAEKRGFYPTLVYLAYSGSEPAGIVSVRLTEDPFIRTYAGHIGYHVRPACRRMGYGKQLLRFATELCLDRSILHPAVCTDPGNLPSQKTALSCGYQPAGQVIYRQERRILRFEWK